MNETIQRGERLLIYPGIRTQPASNHIMAAAIIPEGIKDDKAEHVVPFILKQLSNHENRHRTSSIVPPLIVGLTAPQGAGKSLLVSLLHKALVDEQNISTTIFSLDDFYLPHDGLLKLAESNPSNPLLQQRGQPSTHEVSLVRKVFSSLLENKPTKIPQFNKAAFSGQGDRVSESDWLLVNSNSSNPVRVVLFEGWCVGFRSLKSEELECKHADATRKAGQSDYAGRLGHVELQHVQTINDALKQYDEITSQFDGLIHIDAQDPSYVYDWRQEQEHNLIKAKGSGMIDEQVKKFVDGYYPSYELYVDGLRQGKFQELLSDNQITDILDRQLCLVVGKDRMVKHVRTI